MENIMFANYNLVVSEIQEDSVSLNAKFIICDFGVNGNYVMLNRKTIETWMSSLVGQPVVAAITINDDGTADFDGHNFVLVNRIDKDGNPYQYWRFDTEAFGTFLSVEIEQINGKEYIVATAKLWKRFADFCALVKKRLTEGTLSTSWEIAVEKSHFEMIGGYKVKVIDAGQFMGHALLNKSLPPAYQDSQLLEVANQNQNDLDLIAAIKQDIIKVAKEDDCTLKKTKMIVEQSENTANTTVEDNTVVAETTEPVAEIEPVSGNTTDESAVNDESTTETSVEPEQSAMTEYDLWKEIRQSIANKLNVDEWEFCIIYHFPVDKVVWVQKWDAESELDIIKFTYTVENDVVTVSEPEDGKLTVSVSQINATVEEMQNKIDELTDSLVKASAEITEKVKIISELTPYKEEFEKAEQERIAAETQIKRDELKSLAIMSGYIHDDELNPEASSFNQDIHDAIYNLDEKSVKAVIADRLVSSLKDTKSPVEVSAKTPQEKPIQKPKASLNIDSDSPIGISGDEAENMIKYFVAQK